MKKLLLPITLLSFLVPSSIWAVAPNEDPVLGAARTEAADQASTAESVAKAAKDAAIAEGLTEEDAITEAAYAASRAVAEKEFEASGDATLAGEKARDAALAAGIDEADASWIAGNEAVEGVVQKALAEGKTAAQVAAIAKTAAEGAGLDSEAATERAADIATEKVAEKAIAEGKTASEVAAETKAAAEGAGLNPEDATERAADIAAEKVTEQAISEGKSATEVAEAARAATEGAGLDAETAKEKAAGIAARQVTEKALADGLSPEDAAIAAKAAAEGAGLEAEDAKSVAADIASEKVAEKAAQDGKSAVEIEAEALRAAKAAGLEGEEADDLARANSEGKFFEEDEGNRTPVVENVGAAQIEGTKLLRVTYDLEVSDGRPCTVTIRWSTNNGETFDTTAAAITGAVGPGVEPGEGLEAIWDMGEDWNNKYTEEGRIEVIANRIPPEPEVVEVLLANWNVSPDGKQFGLVNFLPEEPAAGEPDLRELALSKEDLDKIEAAVESDSINFVVIHFRDDENNKQEFAVDGQAPNVKINTGSVSFVITVNHTEEIVPGTDLLGIEGFLSPPGEHEFILGQLPGKFGTGKFAPDAYLRLEFYIGLGKIE